MSKKPASKKTRRPAPNRKQIIVLVDGAENYYEFERSVIERARVPERRKEAVLEELRAAPSAVSYINQTSIPGSIVGNTGGMVLHYAGFYMRSAQRRN